MGQGAHRGAVAAVGNHHVDVGHEQTVVDEAVYLDVARHRQLSRVEGWTGGEHDLDIRGAVGF